MNVLSHEGHEVTTTAASATSPDLAMIGVGLLVAIAVLGYLLRQHAWD